MENKIIRQEVLALSKRYKVIRVRKIGQDTFEISLEGGLGYQWSEEFLLKKGLHGLKAGDVIEISGKNGDSVADLWGPNLKNVKMFSRA